MSEKYKFKVKYQDYLGKRKLKWDMEESWMDVLKDFIEFLEIGPGYRIEPKKKAAIIAAIIDGEEK